MTPLPARMYSLIERWEGVRADHAFRMAWSSETIPGRPEWRVEWLRTSKNEHYLVSAPESDLTVTHLVSGIKDLGQSLGITPTMVAISGPCPRAALCVWWTDAKNAQHYTSTALQNISSSQED